MYTIYLAKEMMRRTHEERLRYAALRRTRNLALRRSRVRTSMRRVIEEGIRYGIEPRDVEREFAETLQQVTSR